MSRVDLKVVLLGKEYGGKTSLVERFLNDRFLEIPYQNTIGAAFGAKQMRIGNRSVVMGIWDTAGGERYEAMSRIYYRGARGAIVCYDMTDSTSFERTRFWVEELRKNEETCNIYLCGTKKDLTEGGARQVDYHQVDDFAKEMKAKAFETSAKSGEQVSEIFNKIAEDFVRSSPTFSEDQRQQTGNVTLRTEKATKNFLCC